jgi:hypothetical protein
VVYFLSQHADGILKDRVAEFENKLVEIRESSGSAARV